MAVDSEPGTPPKQTPDDPNLADRRLSDEQKRSLRNEPSPAEPDAGMPLPDPNEVGEDG